MDTNIRNEGKNQSDLYHFGADAKLKTWYDPEYIRKELMV